MTNDVTMNDVATMISIIDVSSKRGAIEGAEMAVVGTLRTKLAAVLEKAQKAQEALDAKRAEDADVEMQDPGKHKASISGK